MYEMDVERRTFWGKLNEELVAIRHDLGYKPTNVGLFPALYKYILFLFPSQGT